MKKIITLIFLVALTGCVNGNQKAINDNKKVETISKEEKQLKFVVAPQYEGKSSDLIELGQKLVKEHPELGSDGNMAIYFTGAISDGQAAMMLVNKTDVNIKKDLEFSLTWGYDGKTILDKQQLHYSISDNGELPSYSATIVLIPLNDEKLEIVRSMTDASKIHYELSDIRSVN